MIKGASALVGSALQEGFAVISAAADAEGGSRRASRGALSSQLLQLQPRPRVGSSWDTAGRIIQQSC